MTLFPIFEVECGIENAVDKSHFQVNSSHWASTDAGALIPIIVIASRILQKLRKRNDQKRFTSGGLLSVCLYHPLYSERFRSEVFYRDEHVLCHNGTSSPSTEHYHHHAGVKHLSVWIYAVSAMQTKLQNPLNSWTDLSPVNGLSIPKEESSNRQIFN